jgi:hypothetical protein
MAVVGSRPRRNLLDTSQSRDSNALRASVLEAALELGISTSRPLADLIFNTVDEEDELEVRIPFLRSFALPLAFFFFLRPSSSRTATELPLSSDRTEAVTL